MSIEEEIKRISMVINRMKAMGFYRVAKPMEKYLTELKELANEVRR